MNWIIPGTALEGRREDAGKISEQFSAMFLAGDMVLGQVSRLSGLPDYMVQNWVKRGFLSAPKAKRYSLNQLCRVLTINMLRGALSIDQIINLLQYINGRLDDESDDLISDSQLYFLFVELAGDMGADTNLWAEKIEARIALLDIPDASTRQRICSVLSIMLRAYIASYFKTTAENQISLLLKE